MIRNTVLGASAVAFLAAGPALAAMEATATTDLNLRAGPGSNYQVQDVITGNDMVMVDGCLEAANWCQVTYNDTTGWAYGDYLTVSPEGGEPMALYPNRQQVEVETVTYNETENATSAAITSGFGAFVGSLIGGPAAVAAGAIAGAATGAEVAPEPETVTYL